MLQVSGAKIKEIVNEINGKEVDGIQYTYTGKMVGIQATFTTNIEDENLAKEKLKKYLKQNMGHLRIYIEVI